MPDEKFVASAKKTSTCHMSSKLGSEQNPNLPPQKSSPPVGTCQRSCVVQSPTPGRRFSLDRGSLDAYSDALLGWVADRCPDEGWENLLAMAGEPGAPPWLNRTALGLDDQVSHQVLA